MWWLNASPCDVLSKSKALDSTSTICVRMKEAERRMRAKRETKTVEKIWKIWPKSKVNFTQGILSGERMSHKVEEGWDTLGGGIQLGAIVRFTQIRLEMTTVVLHLWGVVLNFFKIIYCNNSKHIGNTEIKNKKQKNEKNRNNCLPITICHFIFIMLSIIIII